MPDRHLDVRGDALECLEALCQARKVYPPRRRKNAIAELPNQRTVERATVSIEKELAGDVARLHPNARTASGDQIAGMKITIRSRGGFTRDKLYHLSKADKGIKFSSVGHTVATVDYAFEHAQARYLRLAQSTSVL